MAGATGAAGSAGATGAGGFGGVAGTAGGAAAAGIGGTGGLAGAAGAGGTGASACTSDAECAPNGWCRPTLSGPSQCTPFRQEGQSCGGFTPIEHATRCQPGLICWGRLVPVDGPGRCSRPCKTDVDCGPGRLCVRGQGVCQDAAGGGGPGDPCASDGECMRGLVCEGCGPAGQRCVTGCRTAQDCRLGQQCRQIQCVTCPCPAQCVGQGRACTARECGPQPGAPNIPCPDGINFSGPGPCERQPDGSCAYTWLSCPSTLPACVSGLPQGWCNPSSDRPCSFQGNDCTCAPVCSGVAPPPGMTHRWSCVPPRPPECPAAAPHNGTPCLTEGLTCSYGSCGAAHATCANGLWSVLFVPPPP
ncbi:MAG: hypothetical protein MJD61_17325 [Proteobacteria bacterium]|nr:hypothetical protein [Pseudomonadota bacterium]